MFQIRRGVFETNSSSTHSICITESNKKLDMLTRLDFTLGNFGWQVQTLRKPEEKAAYLYTAIWSIYDKKTANKKTNELYEMLSEEEVECSFARPEFTEYGKYLWLENGSIDHSGEYGLRDFVEKTLGNKRRLLRFLFSEESFILTGNDNDDLDVDINVNYDHEEYYKGN